MDKTYVAVAGIGDIPPGSCRSFTVAGVKLILAHLADGFHAVEDHCSHAGSPLDASRLYKGSQIVCPLHGARFDVRTGTAKTPPAFRPLTLFPVRIRDAAIEVALPESRAG